MKIAQVMAGAPAGGAELFFERLTVALAQAGETVLPVIRRNAARAARLRAGVVAPAAVASPVATATGFDATAAAPAVTLAKARVQGSRSATTPETPGQTLDARFPPSRGQSCGHDEAEALVAADASPVCRRLLPPIQLGFGGPLDMLTGPRLRATLHRFAPQVVVAWMNRAARFTPCGDWVLAGRLGGYYDLAYYRRCDHLIGNTRGIAEWIVRQGWPAARAHYLPNFSPDMANAAPAQLALPDDARVVLALGRLHRNKAFDVLIRALARVANVHAVIAGVGPEHAALLDLARREGVADRLHLLGWRADTASLLARADMLVCPSRHEPLGNVVIEAWSAGRPVIAAAADGPRELITPDADGVLVPTEDPDALADAFVSLLDDPARAAALATAGRLRYEAEYAEAPVIARWRQFLATVEKP